MFTKVPLALTGGFLSPSERAEVTRVLCDLARGADLPETRARLFPRVYSELRQLADRHLRRERLDHTLQATDIVHEAYLKLVNDEAVDWKGRAHFYAVASSAIRNLLVDHARRRGRAKRGGGMRRVTLKEDLDAVLSGELGIDDLLALEAALQELESIDSRQSQIVEMRCFGGLKVDEVAEALGVSKRTVEGDWTHARAWLKRRLSGGVP